MAKLIWLGEPTGSDDGPRFNTWNGIKFERGQEVEVSNEHMIAKARRMPSYSVDGETYVPGKDEPQKTKPQAKAHKPAGPVIADKTQLSEMNVAELREQAEIRGIDVEGLTKVEIREKLAETPAT